mgnify:CR=1 FL=1
MQMEFVKEKGVSALTARELATGSAHPPGPNFHHLPEHG